MPLNLYSKSCSIINNIWEFITNTDIPQCRFHGNFTVLLFDVDSNKTRNSMWPMAQGSKMWVGFNRNHQNDRLIRISSNGVGETASGETCLNERTWICLNVDGSNIVFYFSWPPLFHWQYLLFRFLFNSEKARYLRLILNASTYFPVPQFGARW